MLMIWNYNVLWGINMKYLHILILTIVFSGCSTLKTNEVQLFDSYNQLFYEVKEGDIIQNRYKYFTNNYLKEVNPEDANSRILLKLSNYINKEISHYQKINDSYGCLSINGFDENKEPLSLHIEYKIENNMWLINYIFVSFLESTSNYAIQATCPHDAEAKILETMHNE